MIDLGEVYRSGRERIASMVDDSVASRPVPATPEWDVHDVIAHVSGIVDDALAGNTEGATTDPWTAAQVERCRGQTVTEMIDRWTACAPGFEHFLSSPAGFAAAAAVIDLFTQTAHRGRGARLWLVD